jgi:glutamate racemase
MKSQAVSGSLSRMLDEMTRSGALLASTEGHETGPGRTAQLRRPRILVFDSGLGGLTVLEAIIQKLPDAELSFAADDAVFPYGRLSEGDLVARVVAVMDRLIEMTGPDLVVIACHTASTLVLPPLRARYPHLAFVGTVPAIKPAAALSRSRLVSVLATPGTVARQYTHDLVARFAGNCAVTLVGSPRLASLAEAAMRGEAVEDAAILPEMVGAFVETEARGRTDAVVLACTHYPLLLDRFTRLAPWPVTWVDPAPAIARRAAEVASERGLDVTSPGPAAAERAIIPAVMTSGRAPGETLAAFLRGRGLEWQPGPAF